MTSAEMETDALARRITGVGDVLLVTSIAAWTCVEPTQAPVGMPYSTSLRKSSWTSAENRRDR